MRRLWSKTSTAIRRSGKRLTVAILDGTAEVIQPLTVATLAICIVFFPVVLLTGPARYLFIPLAITVVLAMLASYVLSFAMLPAFARYVLTEHEPAEGEGSRFVVFFERAFSGLREAYGRALARRVAAARVHSLLFRRILIAVTGCAGSTSSAAIFSQPPMSGSSSCTCARRPATALKPRNGKCWMSRNTSAI